MRSILRGLIVFIGLSLISCEDVDQHAFVKDVLNIAKRENHVCNARMDTTDYNCVTAHLIGRDQAFNNCVSARRTRAFNRRQVIAQACFDYYVFYDNESHYLEERNRSLDSTCAYFYDNRQGEKDLIRELSASPLECFRPLSENWGFRELVFEGLVACRVCNPNKRR